MLRSQYALLCDDARPSVHGTLDLMGVFDRVFAEKVPAVHRRLAFVSLLVADSEDDLGTHRLRLLVLDPNGGRMIEHSGSVTLKPEGGTHLGSARLQVTFEGFPLPQYGRYSFRLEVDGHEVASHPLSVIAAKGHA